MTVISKETSSNTDLEAAYLVVSDASKIKVS
jgi:hypothetical protein